MKGENLGAQKDFSSEFNKFLNGVLSEISLSKVEKKVDQADLFANLSKSLAELRKSGIIDDQEFNDLLKFFVSRYVNMKVEELVRDIFNIKTDFSWEYLHRFSTMTLNRNFSDNDDHYSPLHFNRFSTMTLNRNRI